MSNALRLDADTVARVIRAEIRHFGGRIRWEQIKLAVEVHFDLDPTRVNWLTEVRRPLQALINAGEVRRAGGPQVEEYEFTTQPKETTKS